jgi:serine/threonine protein kinase
MTPHYLGPYLLLDNIAFGGMAEIYRALVTDELGNMRLVAVKKILDHLARDNEFVQMLQDEAQIASPLLHPNIARVYEFQRTPSSCFLAMEYIEGKDLRTLLDRCRSLGKPLPLADILYIAISILKALHRAHTCIDAQRNPLRIIHRDVSPSNVLISYRGEVKLIDFGIAKAVMSRVRTQTGVIKGKIRYMSPEQAQGEELDPRSDIFSLGLVLYEMLVLQPAFQAESDLELLFKVRDANIPPLRHPEIDQVLGDLIQKALGRTREQRYNNADELASMLGRHLYARFPSYHPSSLARTMQMLFAKEQQEEQDSLERVLSSVQPPAPAAPVPRSNLATKPAIQVAEWQSGSAEEDEDAQQTSRFEPIQDESIETIPMNRPAPNGTKRRAKRNTKMIR